MQKSYITLRKINDKNHSSKINFSFKIAKRKKCMKTSISIAIKNVEQHLH